MRHRRLVAAMAVGVVCLTFLSAHAARGFTVRMSSNSAGVQGNGDSRNPDLSGDGRWVAFDSTSTNLVSPDGPASDVFVKDSVGEPANLAPEDRIYRTVKVSQPSNGASTAPSISADGRFIAFASDATNLDTRATSGVTQIYVRDRDFDGNGALDEAGTDKTATMLISTSTAGYVAGNGNSSQPAISGDGTAVAFTSAATNLAVNADDNAKLDVFVRDRDLNGDGLDAQGRPLAGSRFDQPGDVRTRMVSINSGGSQVNGDSFDPALSDSGRVVIFSSDANNLAGPGNNLDMNGATDVFMRTSGKTTMLSLGPGNIQSLAGQGSNLPTVSRDGKVVAFVSRASNFAYKTDPGQLPSPAQAQVPGVVSADMNALPDIFMRDVVQGITRLISLNRDGDAAGAEIDRPVVSDDGTAITFSSSATDLGNATDLAPQDINGSPRDVWLRDLLGATTEIVSLRSNGTSANGESWSPAVSGDGHYVAWISDGDFSDAGIDANGVLTDIFLRDRRACAYGMPENGPVSGQLATLERSSAQAGPPLHEISCGVVVAHGA